MWHYYQYHSGFLTKVFCIVTCIFAEAMVLLMTLPAWICEAVPYMGLWKRFLSHRSIPFSQVGLAVKAGRWLCLTHQSLHKNLALGDRGLGWKSQIVPTLSVFLKLNLYSDLFGQTSISVPEEVAEAGK